ncbi:asparaginase [Aromatoleum toluclasticum]|uniref:asparaginase n=1 Tax=Aromatoleum toluclasticum TaxID=92003 RepID=UPI001D1925C5|nr:asparaginase [Aromatoleum toluclasticum]MCC4114138.1 asparaginase [Aromatoleum toluclasticum]
MPTLALIATGGTIAGAAASATDTTGYTAGALGADALLAAVPQLAEIAQIRAEQLFKLDSKDMEPGHWLALGRRVQALLDDDAIDGIVITHGTDTLEETAAFLQLTLAGTKPVVLTAAMRPATALSADGPMNLYNAACVAAHPDSAGRGTLVSFGEAIFPALGLRKCQTHRLDAFAGTSAGAIGRHDPVRYFAPAADAPARTFAAPADAAALPRVDVLYVGAGTPPDLVDLVVANGARGIVLALPGNGSLPAAWESPVAAAVAQGIPVIRASRAGMGAIGRKALDARLGTHPTGELPASQARVALMLALAGGDATTLARLLADGYIP